MSHILMFHFSKTGERQKQLQVLLAQWQGWRNSATQTGTSHQNHHQQQQQQQSRKYLTEAFALKFESLKSADSAPRDSNVMVELIAELQKKQDAQCRKILDVGSLVCFFMTVSPQILITRLNSQDEMRPIYSELSKTRI